MKDSEIRPDVKLSVAVITYNQEKTISRTLESILGQEHDYTCEVVVGDDCSSDGTRDILRGYAARYPGRVRLLLNEKNLGVVGNYFNVIAHCRGEYIMECAGDDWWLPGKVARQVSYLDARPECGMCYAEAVFAPEGRLGSKVWKGRKDNGFGSLMKSNPVPALTAAMRRGLVLRYIEEVAPCTRNWKMEDYPMWLWFAHESRIGFLPQPLGAYNVATGSLSHADSMDRHLAFVNSSLDIQEFFNERFSWGISRSGFERKRWTLELRARAVYCRPGEFVRIWWAGIRRNPSFLFDLSAYKYCIFFLFPGLGKSRR